jgi:hypothetical protein
MGNCTQSIKQCLRRWRLGRFARAVAAFVKRHGGVGVLAFCLTVSQKSIVANVGI